MKRHTNAGNNAVFQCGRNILRIIIAKKEEGGLTKALRKDEGSLSTLLHNLFFKEIISTANSIQEATAYIKKLYGTTEGTFTAYQFALSR